MSMVYFLFEVVNFSLQQSIITKLQKALTKADVRMISEHVVLSGQQIR